MSTGDRPIAPGELPRPSGLARRWSLAADVVHLNHGSFGACPTAVLERQAGVRARMEREAMRFFVEDMEPLLDEARLFCADFVGCDAEGFAFVLNATMGVNTVVRSLAGSPGGFGRGDEVITSTQEYNACTNALRFAAERVGASVVSVDLPFPVGSEDEVVERIVGAVTARTRLALVSHVTSPTGIVLPARRIAAELADRGVDVILDGAHAPGMLDLDVGATGAAYYTGNFHKWCCAPKGSAFLYVREDKRELIRPLIVSHGANSPRADRSRYRLEMDYIGAMDPSAWMVTPDAIRELASMHERGWAGLRADLRAMALRGRDLLCGVLGTHPPSPDGMIGTLAAVRLPDRRPEEGEPGKYPDPLWERLIERRSVQIPVIPFPEPPRRWVRLSAAPYNSVAQYEYLAEALREELGIG